MEIITVIKNIYVLWIYNPTRRNQSHRNKDAAFKDVLKDFVAALYLVSKLKKQSGNRMVAYQCGKNKL